MREIIAPCKRCGVTVRTTIYENAVDVLCVECLIKEETDLINTPSHYHKGGVDVITFCKGKLSDERQAGFFQMNVLKYVTRYQDKNGVEDLQKAKFYIDKLIELESVDEKEIYREGSI